MRLVVAPITASLAACLPGQPVTYDIKFGGTTAGSNRVTVKPDGSFVSESKFSIQGITVESSMVATVKDGRITTYTFREKAGKDEGVFRWNGRTVDIDVNGKSAKKALPFAPKTRAFITNYHPILWATVLSEFKASKKSPIDAVLLNSLADLKMKVEQSEATVILEGKPTQVTKLKTELMSIGIEIALVDGVAAGVNVPAQLFQIVRRGYESVFVDPLAKYPELSQPTYKAVNETRLRAKMRDNVELFADIIKPSAPGKYPVILVRTPYGRLASLIGMSKYAERGYVVVSQDVRGRGASGGQWDPFNTEVADGKDTLDWLVAQPWCDGNVGMIGGSYLGFVQWAAAVNHHPALKCIIPQVSPPEPTRNVPWDNGNFLLAGSVWWSRIVADRQADMSKAGDIPNLKALLTMPLSQVDDKLIGRDVPFYNEWLKRPNRADWKGAFTTAQVGMVKIPVLHVSGVWDGDGVGTMIHWNTLRAAKGNQWLIFGPWDHAFNTKTKMGDQDFGAGAVLELDSVYLRFFDTNLKGMSAKWDEQPRVRFFETGSNRWLNGPDWPTPTAKKIQLFLASGPNNKTFGKLGNAPGKGSASLDYNPAKATIEKEMAEIDPNKAVTTAKPADFSEIALGFQGPAFAKDTALAGPLVAELYISSTAKDASFHVQVFDQEPSGKLWAICQAGNMRAGYVNGKLNSIVPNRIYKITVEPWLFARRFKKGHRLVVTVRNDLFPGFARIPGTGLPDGEATKFVRSTNTVHTSAKYPSRVTLWENP